jgi:type I restriction enzyme S subunit
MKKELDNIYTWEIPASWAYAKLEDLGKGENAIVDGPFGSNLKVSDYIDDPVNGVPVLTTKNLEGQYSEGTVRYISQEKYNELRRSSVNPGDILVAKIGSVGKTGIYPQGFKTAIIPANLLKFTSTDKIAFNYLYLYLNYFEFQKFINKISTATAQPAFNLTKFRKLPIPIPPTNEQKRIVAKIEELFSELDKGIESLKTAREQLKVYRQAVLKYAFEGKLTTEWREQNKDKLETADQLLERIEKEREAYYHMQLREWKASIVTWETDGKEGKKPSQPKLPDKIVLIREEDLQQLPELPQEWMWIKLSNISKNIQIGPFGSLLHQHDYVVGGWPLVNPSHIKNQQIYPDNNLTVTTEKLKELTNYRLQEGDIIMGRRGEMGRCAVVTSKESGWLCGTGSLFVRLLDSYSPWFYCQTLSSQRAREYLSSSSIGTTMQNLNQKILYEMPVPVCSVEEQIEIMREVERQFSVIDGLEETIEEELQKSDALRQSILKKAFSGKLVAQDPNDEPASVLLERIRAEKEAQSGKKKPKQEQGADSILELAAIQTGAVQTCFWP